VAYGMSKAAIHSLVRHVALRFGPQGVRANAIAPGVIAHKRFWEVMPPEYVDAMKAEIPMRRLGTPEDIAALGALLLSYDGSFINGQVISVDGGGSMRL
jgi:NAD(P)-dependent dehydrogenase (short-subunit alcohol dehydrogenase family)